MKGMRPSDRESLTNKECVDDLGQLTEPWSTCDNDLIVLQAIESHLPCRLALEVCAKIARFPGLTTAITGDVPMLHCIERHHLRRREWGAPPRAMSTAIAALSTLDRSAPRPKDEARSSVIIPGVAVEKYW